MSIQLKGEGAHHRWPLKAGARHQLLKRKK
jgi:hypothetical protein